MQNFLMSLLVLLCGLLCSSATYIRPLAANTAQKVHIWEIYGKLFSCFRIPCYVSDSFSFAFIIIYIYLTHFLYSNIHITYGSSIQTQRFWWWVISFFMIKIFFTWNIFFHLAFMNWHFSTAFNFNIFLYILFLPFSGDFYLLINWVA